MKVHDTKVFEDFLRFSAEHLRSQDIDPAYPLLKASYAARQLSPEVALWYTFLYVTWYHLGSAELAWAQMPEPRAAVRSGASLRLSTGVERRNFRGNELALEHIHALVGSPLRTHGTLQRWVEACCDAPTPEAGWRKARAAFETLPGSGSWASYKWADLLAHVHDYPIRADSIVGGLGTSAGPLAGMSRVTGLSAQQCAADVDAQLQLLDACWQRGVAFSGLDQLETSLCDFNSLAKGHYYLGHDIDMQMNQLAPSSDVFWSGRRAVFEEPYLGEVGGWKGVRRDRLRAYADSGRLL